MLATGWQPRLQIAAYLFASLSAIPAQTLTLGIWQHSKQHLRQTGRVGNVEVQLVPMAVIQPKTSRPPHHHTGIFILRNQHRQSTTTVRAFAQFKVDAARPIGTVAQQVERKVD
ncbi:hypothetical protein D3C77_293810 [compost metagenome]